MKELLETAERYARAAGQAIGEEYNRGTTVSRKGMVDLVTTADNRAEEIIVQGIRNTFPDHSILAEESGEHLGSGQFRWIVDPLDGTVNFAHGIPHFSVLIAIEECCDGGQFATRAGLVFDPMRDEMFLASEGQGATLNGSPIMVSSTDTLLDSVLATGFGYQRLFVTDNNHAEFCRLNLLTQGVRRFGSAGLDLAYVACGRYDGFWEYGLNPWDQASGLLLVREAGGQVSNLDGDDAPVDTPHVAASNGHLHEKLLRAIDSARDLPVDSREGLAEHLPEDIAAQLQAKSK